MQRLARHLTFANVMSVTAVFIALGGSAVAISLQKNSVGAKQIKTGAVRSAEVKDSSLLDKDFAPGELPAGQKGDRGAEGPPGPPGTPATRIYAFVRTGGCCGGSPPLNPPQLQNAHGVTAVSIAGTGRYEVTFDTAQLPTGDVKDCVPLVSIGSSDAGGMTGQLTFARANGLPKDRLDVRYANSAGTPAELHSGGGAFGFSIALFC